MNIHENEDAIVINLKDLAILFLKRLWIILLAAVIVAGSCFAWLTYSYEEEYTSTAKIFLYYTDGVKSASAAASYLEVALYVVNDCEQFLTSRPVINKVILDLLWYNSLRHLGLTHSDCDTLLNWCILAVVECFVFCCNSLQFFNAFSWECNYNLATCRDSITHVTAIPTCKYNSTLVHCLAYETCHEFVGIAASCVDFKT